MAEQWKVGEVAVVNRDTDDGHSSWVSQGTVVLLTKEPLPGNSLWTATIPSTGNTRAMFFPSELERVDD